MIEGKVNQIKDWNLIFNFKNFSRKNLDRYLPEQFEQADLRAQEVFREEPSGDF